MLLRLSVLLVLVLVAPPPARAQLATDAEVVAELKRIGQAIESLEETMRLTIERSRISLLLQRAELEVAGITALESQVRNARAAHAAQVRQEEEMTTYLDDLQRREFDEQDEERKEGLRAERRGMARQMESVRKQTRVAEQRLFELEDELARRSDTFDALKARVDELLELD